MGCFSKIFSLFPIKYTFDVFNRTFSASRFFYVATINIWAENKQTIHFLLLIFKLIHSSTPFSSKY